MTGGVGGRNYTLLCSLVPLHHQQIVQVFPCEKELSQVSDNKNKN